MNTTLGSVNRRNQLQNLKNSLKELKAIANSMAYQKTGATLEAIYKNQELLCYKLIKTFELIIQILEGDQNDTKDKKDNS